MRLRDVQDMTKYRERRKIIVGEAEKDEICMFSAGQTGNFCKILVGEKCDGKNHCCSFWKTEEQFQAERDKAITLNRMRGNCLKCRYMGDFCKLSTEEKVVSNFF